jgi:hypothetical protein
VSANDSIKPLWIASWVIKVLLWQKVIFSSKWFLKIADIYINRMLDSVTSMLCKSQRCDILTDYGRLYNHCNLPFHLQNEQKWEGPFFPYIRLANIPFKHNLIWALNFQNITMDFC